MSTPFHWSAILDQATHRMMMRYHPEVGHLYVPGISARMPHARGGYTVRTNSQGFRSNVEFDTARNGKPRILVFGDSFTDGQGVDNHERYSDVLAERLGASVYNYGISGSAPDQQLLIYERLAKSVATDLIVWGIAVHNIERIRHTHRPSTDRLTGRPVLVPKPYFTLEAGELRLHHVPAPRVRPALEGDERRFLDEPTDLILAARLRMPRVYAAARRVFDDWFPNLKHRLRSIVYRAANIQANEDYLNAASAGWVLLAAVIKRFAASAAGTPVLVVPLPTYHYCVDKIRPVYDPLFAGLADPQAGLHVFPITARLVAGRSLRDRLRYFEQEGHYSPVGHTAIAELLAQEIARLSLIPPPPATRAPSSASRSSQRNALGTSFDERGGAAVLVQDGQVIAGGVEDVFVRRHDHGGFPDLAVNYCLEEGGIHQNHLAAAGRARHTARRIQQQVSWAASQRSEYAWASVVGAWRRDELRTGQAFREHMQYEGLGVEWPYGAAQCMSALEGCPFDRMAILSLHDSVDGTVATIASGDGSRLRVIKELSGHQGLGDLGRAVATLLGLPAREPFRELAALRSGRAVSGFEDVARGAVAITQEGFSIASLDARWLADQFKIAERGGEHFHESARQAAASVIAIAAEVVRRLAIVARRDTGESRVCLSGEVFQAPEAVVAGAAPFGEASVHSLEGHAAAALGAALLTWQHAFGDWRRSPSGVARACGPAFSNGEIQAFLETYALPYRDLSESTTVLRDVLAAGRLLGVFGGRLCLTGPSAGSRGILFKGRPGEISSSLEAHCDNQASTRYLSAEAWGLVGDLRIGDPIMVVPLQLRGEPVALTPFDAYRCMMEGQLEALVLGDWLVLKPDQPAWTGTRPRSRRQARSLDADEAWVHREVRRHAPHLASGAEAAPRAWTAVDSEAASLGILVQPAIGRGESDPLVSAVAPGKLRTRVGKLLRETVRRSE